MPRSYLESALASACPSFEREWALLRATYPPDEPPSADGFLAALRAHVCERLAGGRVADVTRLFFAVERLLDGADPVLQELLEDRFLAPLAADCRAAAVDPRLVLPHLGARSRAAWERSES
jgi:hypothetical protein